MITVDEMKKYLRVDSDDEDALIESLIASSTSLCMDIARISDNDTFESLEVSRIAVMYAVAYQFEHREEADHHELTLTLRSLLFGIREGVF